VIRNLEEEAVMSRPMGKQEEVRMDRKLGWLSNKIKQDWLEVDRIDIHLLIEEPLLVIMVDMYLLWIEQVDQTTRDKRIILLVATNLIRVKDQEVSMERVLPILPRELKTERILPLVEWDLQVKNKRSIIRLIMELIEFVENLQFQQPLLQIRAVRDKDLTLAIVH